MNPRLSYWKYWQWALLVVFTIGGVMSFHPYFKVQDLICIEFARDEHAFFSYFECQSCPTLEALHHNTVLDFVFIAAYTALFILSAKLGMIFLGIRHHIILVYFLLPALFDVVENYHLFQLIAQHSEKGYSGFDTFHGAVRIKWLLCIPGLVLSAGMLCVRLKALWYHSKNQKS